jgi:hypothetical protein
MALDIGHAPDTTVIVLGLWSVEGTARGQDSGIDVTQGNLLRSKILKDTYTRAISELAAAECREDDADTDMEGIITGRGLNLYPAHGHNTDRP